MSFTNLYYKRAAGTARACYVCYKPSTTVLATANTVDFFYTCDTHLTDPGFANQVGESNDGVGAGGARKMGLSPEEIAKVKEEWEERQRKKQEKIKEQDKQEETENKDTDKEGVKNKTDQGKTANAASKSPTPTSSLPTAPSAPSHARYTLHRDMFAMRLAEHRKRRQAAQAKALAPRLPGAPRGPIGS